MCEITSLCKMQWPSGWYSSTTTSKYMIPVFNTGTLLWYRGICNISLVPCTAVPPPWIQLLLLLHRGTGAVGRTTCPSRADEQHSPFPAGSAVPLQGQWCHQANCLISGVCRIQERGCAELVAPYLQGEQEQVCWNKLCVIGSSLRWNPC